MIHKRPFVDEDSYEVATKFPRQLEHIDQQASAAPADNSRERHQGSDCQVKDSFPEHQDIERFSSDVNMRVPNRPGNDFETDTASCFPHFLWINNGLLEADNLPLFPEYFDHGHQLRALLEPDEVVPALDYPIQKPVSIGPEHQASIPEWHPPDLVIPLNQLENSDLQAAGEYLSSSSGRVIDDYEQRLMGSCVIPMREQGASESYCCVTTETECRCSDGGSIRCVRQHVTEARQKLRDSLGDEVFSELGFCDMGEGVAQKWTEVEEQAFCEVVVSNPVSLGKNFWEHLSATFPNRTKKEIVSYYFNVFMLRKRAEQNRFDPLNIDSDDDEWHRSEDGMVEEDEDSVVESLTGEDTPADQEEEHTTNHNEYVEDDNEFVASRDGVDNVVHRGTTDEECEEDVDYISGCHRMIPNGSCGAGTECKFFNGVCGNKDDYDAQDDSCTSYEDQRDNCCGPFDREERQG
ncbi:hypothetical protein Tsubulata_016912 [Turnera subulata]|uniref:Myb-like domain-containing protein n=1 Tax=Turnera subulata TaxID=218843 RepID=A0A9Q0G0W0_9ROSI|nr:hypothetical protein Tsubulata_016912 [Turnera subulata]